MDPERGFASQTGGPETSAITSRISRNSTPLPAGHQESASLKVYGVFMIGCDGGASREKGWLLPDDRGRDNSGKRACAASPQSGRAFADFTKDARSSDQCAGRDQHPQDTNSRAKPKSTAGTHRRLWRVCIEYSAMGRQAVVRLSDGSGCPRP